jgi:hypothetical protein
MLLILQHTHQVAYAHQRIGMLSPTEECNLNYSLRAYSTLCNVTSGKQEEGLIFSKAYAALGEPSAGSQDTQPASYQWVMLYRTRHCINCGGNNFPSAISFFCVSHSSHALLAIFVHETRYATLSPSRYQVSIVLYTGSFDSVEGLISSGNVLTTSSWGSRTSHWPLSAFEESNMNSPCISRVLSRPHTGILINLMSLPDIKLTVASSM